MEPPKADRCDYQLKSSAPMNMGQQKSCFKKWTTVILVDRVFWMRFNCAVKNEALNVF